MPELKCGLDVINSQLLLFSEELDAELTKRYLGGEGSHGEVIETRVGT